MSTKNIIKCVVVASVLILIGIAVSGGFEKNNDQNWQVIQSVKGTMSVRDRGGWYPKWFATVTTYPRYYDGIYNAVRDEGKKSDESIRVTFNDGGTAQVGTFVRFSTPTSMEQRLEFHRQFSGNIKNASYSVKAHMINCIKATGPLMSSSENQTARKSEFAQVIESQLIDGLYGMRQVEKTLKDQYDEEGKAITVMATEIITDKNGIPVVAKNSPLENYGIGVLQFSVTEIDYDPTTLKQFAAKKQSFLKAEQMKAQKAEMVAERLKIEEEGKKDVAKAEAIANVSKTTAVIAAELKAEVALQDKIAAETKAAQFLSVAELSKKTLLMEASAKFEQAEIMAKTADEKKKAMIAEAQGKKEAIELSGAITELEQAQIQAEVDKARYVAEALAKINVPQTMIFAGGENGGSVTEQLINIRLLEASSLFDKIDVNRTIVNRKVRPSTKK